MKKGVKNISRRKSQSKIIDWKLFWILIVVAIIVLAVLIVTQKKVGLSPTTTEDFQVLKASVVSKTPCNPDIDPTTNKPYGCIGEVENAIDNNVQTEWYPRASIAEAVFDYGSVIDGDYIVDYSWRGDTTNPLCVGVVSASKDGKNFVELFSAKSSAGVVDGSVLSSIQKNTAFRYIKVRVGGDHSCGWVHIKELTIKKKMGSVGCTADVMQCPDGSYVSRNPNNNCEFYPCKGSCSDSDGGDNEFVKGHTEGYLRGGQFYTHDDICMVTSGNGGGAYSSSCDGENCAVDEAYCEYCDSKIDSNCGSTAGYYVSTHPYFVSCKNGCKDGACIVKPPVPSTQCVTDADCSVNDQCINAGVCVERRRDFISFEDNIKLEKSSDRWNLGEGSPLTGSIGDDDLKNYLASGQLESGEEYEQSIIVSSDYNKFNSLKPVLFRDSDYEEAVGYTEKTPTLGFRVLSNSWILNYTLNFVTDVKGINGKTIPLLGGKYDVINYVPVDKKLTLIESSKKFSLYEGETITVEGHEISIGYIDSDEVKFIVDGFNIPTTGSLMNGQFAKMSGGLYIGVIDIKKQDYTTTASGFVSISVGKSILEMTSGSDIKINGETITGIKGFIYPSYSSYATGVDKIEIEWKNDDEEFLSTEKELIMPEFKNLKFFMKKFNMPSKEVTDIVQSTQNSMKLIVPLRDGSVSFGLAYLNGSGAIGGLGKASDERLAIGVNNLTYYEKKNVDGRPGYADWYHTSFVASYRMSDNSLEASQSYLLRAKVDYDSVDNRNEVTFEKLIPEGWKPACLEKIKGDVCDIGDVSFTITDIQYVSGGDEFVVLAGSKDVYFDRLYTKEGMEIVFPSESAVVGKSSFDLIINSEDKDDNLALGGTYKINIGASPDKEISVLKIVGGSLTEGLEVGDTASYRYIQYTPLATEVIHNTIRDQDTARIIYHGSESYAEVYLSGQSRGGIGGGINTYTLSEGETVTVVIDEKVYEVSISYMSFEVASLKFGGDIGEVTEPLSEGESQVLKDGTKVTMNNIVSQDFEGGINTVTFTVSRTNVVPTCSQNECSYNDECILMGERRQTNYCASSGQMESQRSSGEYCENGYECVSDSCPNNQCSKTPQEEENGFRIWVCRVFGWIVGGYNSCINS
ncbi:hypothetical protein COU57_01845 [Candidatus Pacearchaeota archaeon CG10_big_fil_rev_8_21_14_0_10_32_14]|nr:MAG: hypothetical protein COU57_01845 [Candidatus Pacearchaeota archaeon CG10_big_fil_rev_8_21_14_0_10_32_14]